MPSLAIIRGAEAVAVDGELPSGWDLSETVVRRLSPQDASLQLLSLGVTGSARLDWAGQHGDEAVYVLAGAVRSFVEGRDTTVVAGGAVIIESDVSAAVEASAGVRLLHFAPVDPSAPDSGPFGPPVREKHVVHAVGPAGVYARSAPDGDSRFFADSSCPTCRLTLLLTARTGPYVSAPHSHSQDELIHLLSGSLTVGRETLVAGDTLSIEADRRYTFTGGDAGFSFLNYRRDASLHSIVRHPPPVLEGGANHGFERVGDVVDLLPVS